MKRVKLKPDAPHIPVHHAGDEGRVVEEKPLLFSVWYHVEFADGCRIWTTRSRVTELDT